VKRFLVHEIKSIRIQKSEDTSKSALWACHRFHPWGPPRSSPPRPAIGRLVAAACARVRSYRPPACRRCLRAEPAAAGLQPKSPPARGPVSQRHRRCPAATARTLAVGPAARCYSHLCCAMSACRPAPARMVLQAAAPHCFAARARPRRACRRSTPASSTSAGRCWLQVLVKRGGLVSEQTRTGGRRQQGEKHTLTELFGWI
jgi:hypothetical protein